MAQREADSRASITRSHRVYGENELLHFVLWPPHSCFEAVRWVSALQSFSGIRRVSMLESSWACWGRAWAAKVSEEEKVGRHIRTQIYQEWCFPKQKVTGDSFSVQNNVLELWSLFDFLMPGFLGTERQFAARYGKPILASRDARSSSREQEAGKKELQ